MSDLDKTLMTYSFDASTTLLKIWFCLMMFSTLLEVRWFWELLWGKYEMLIIFRWDLDCGSWGTSMHRELISSAFLTYCSMIYKSDCIATLLVTTIIPKGSDWIKSTRTLDFVFLSNLFMWATCKKLFFMNFKLFLLLIGMMICFLDGPLVVIWIQGFTLGLPLTILLIWSILFTPRDRKASLILMISEVLVPYFKT